MIIEMNPESDEVFGDKLNNSNGHSNPIDEDILEPSPDLDVELDGESDAEPEVEHDAEASFDPDLEYLPRGAELRDVLSSISAMANELESLSYLSDPKNNYTKYRRMQLRSELSTELDKLQRYKVKLDREVWRCERNLNRICTDSEKLHLDETIKYYDQAESLQQKQYREAVHDRDAILWVISKVKVALNAAPITSFPIWDKFPPDISIPPLPKYQNAAGRLGSEIDGLLSLGPMWQR